MITSPPRTLCLGDALVDLVGERSGASLTEIDRFSPHFGGAAANVALVAARAGAQISLVGGAGDDDWGRWLRDRAAGLFISTNTLVGAAERALTMRARELILGRRRRVIFDANLRLHRWGSRTDAAASANACVPGALLVRANREEAEVMTGESDPERAALVLVKAGAQLVIVTLGAAGAILRGTLRATVPGVPCRPINTAGAGDALTGTLLARLALSGFHPSSVAAGLPDAIEAAARACERWGTVD